MSECIFVWRCSASERTCCAACCCAGDGYAENAENADNTALFFYVHEAGEATGRGRRAARGCLGNVRRVWDQALLEDRHI